jgi:hypothetical protein
MSEHHDHRDDCPFKFATLDMCDCVEKNMLDRIEALTKERDRWKDACRSASRDLNIIVPDNDRLKSERDAAEAKLAKAVEALDMLVRDCEADYPPSHGAIKHFAKATLAEIKSGVATTPYGLEGESHE